MKLLSLKNLPFLEQRQPTISIKFWSWSGFGNKTRTHRILSFKNTNQTNSRGLGLSKYQLIPYHGDIYFIQMYSLIHHVYLFFITRQKRHKKSKS